MFPGEISKNNKDQSQTKNVLNYPAKTQNATHESMITGRVRRDGRPPVWLFRSQCSRSMKALPLFCLLLIPPFLPLSPLPCPVDTDGGGGCPVRSVQVTFTLSQQSKISCPAPVGTGGTEGAGIRLGELKV